MIVAVPKKVRPGRKSKDVIVEYVDIDLMQVALMKLHDFSKAEIAQHFDVNPALLAKAILDNRDQIPWQTITSVEPRKIGRPKKDLPEVTYE